MDALDIKCCQRLQEDGRLTLTQLAVHLGLSVPATSERVRKLEEQGIIGGYRAILDPRRVGAKVTAFIAVVVERPEHEAPFLRYVQDLPEVLECHHVAGEDSYLLKVRCTSTEELEHLIVHQIKAQEGVVRTRTTIVLSTAKETTALPIKVTAP